MKFLNTHISLLHGWVRTALRLMLALMTMAGVTACGGDDEIMKIYDATDDNEANIYLTLNVEVAENLAGQYGSRSRAGVDDDYFFERPLTRYETLKTLRVIIVKSADNKVECNRRVIYTDGVLAPGYSMTFKVTPGSKRIYLIGNDTSLPEKVTTDLAALEENKDVLTDEMLYDIHLYRNANEPFFTSEEYIPMTEFFDVDIKANPPSDDNKNTYLYKTLFVTRVATKYTIETPEDYSSLKIRLYGIATEQWLMPHDLEYSPEKYEQPVVIDGISGRAITSFTTPPNTPVNNYEIELTGKTPVSDNDGNFLYYRYDSFYLTETPGTSFKISVLVNNDKVKDTEGELKENWFGPKDFPNLPLLPRNTHVIARLSTMFGLQCEVDVVPYRGCVLEPYFGLHPDYYKPAITEIWKTAQVETLKGNWDSAAPNWTTPDNIKFGANTRFATVSDGKIYTVDQMTMSIAEVTQTGSLVPTYYLPVPTNPADYYGTAIAADEAGNFLVGMNFVQRPYSSTKFAIYNPATGTCKEFDLNVPEGWTVGRLDCIGRVLGDLTQDAIFTIAPENGYTSEVRIIEVKGDGTLASVTMTDIGNVPVAGNYTQQNIAVPAYHTIAEAKAEDAVQDFYYSSCTGEKNYYASYIGGVVTSDFARKMLTTSIAGTNGFDTFVVDGKRYFVRNWAVNATERTMNIVVMDDEGKALARWENKSYVLDGGYSTIVTVPLEDNTVDIYVFNSGNRWGAAAKLNFNPAQVH